MTIKFLNPRRDNLFGGWSRRCEVDGVEYQCAIKKGRRVRIPYKPRGQNVGFWWYGKVYGDGKLLFDGRVIKSLGCHGLLVKAGVIE